MTQNKKLIIGTIFSIFTINAIQSCNSTAAVLGVTAVNPVVHSIKKSKASKKFSDEKIQQVVTGKTTKVELQKLFGKPKTITANSTSNQSITGESITKKQETYIYVDYGKVLNVLMENDIVQSFQFSGN